MLSFAPSTLRSLVSSTSSLASSSLPRRSLSLTPSLSYPRGAPDSPFLPRQPGHEPVLPPRERAYPSKLHSRPHKYKKEQRANWLGPESDEPMSGVQRIDPSVMHMNPDHPLFNTRPDAKPSTWFVQRTQAGDYLPVYVEYCNSEKSEIRTVIQHIEGDSHIMLDSLLHHLLKLDSKKKRAFGRVTKAQGNIEIKGNWKGEVVEFLLSRGM